MIFRPRAFALPTVVAALLYTVSSVHAQAQGGTEATLIARAAACANCRVQVDSILTLGSPVDSVLIDEAPGVARDSRGRFFARASGAKQIIVFDSLGKFRGLFGKEGQGPGEFARSILQILVLSDSIYVLAGDGTVSVFSPALRFVRSIQLPNRPTSIWILPRDSTVLMQAAISTPSKVGLPLHIVQEGSIM
jgi:hypothetical protein